MYKLFKDSKADQQYAEGGLPCVGKAQAERPFVTPQ